MGVGADTGSGAVSVCASREGTSSSPRGVLILAKGVKSAKSGSSIGRSGNSEVMKVLHCALSRLVALIAKPEGIGSEISAGLAERPRGWSLGMDKQATAEPDRVGRFALV